MMYYLGIDPGKAGGLAIINKWSVAQHEYTHVYVTAMLWAGKTVDILGVADWIENIVVDMDDFVAYIEKVGAMPKQGVTSMFNFGFSTGMIHGMLRSWGVPLHEVRPQDWKKDILHGTAKDKAAAADFCRRVYPEVILLATERSKKPHSGISDALCIARYATLNY